MEIKIGIAGDQSQGRGFVISFFLDILTATPLRSLVKWG